MNTLKTIKSFAALLAGLSFTGLAALYFLDGQGTQALLSLILTTLIYIEQNTDV